jgi:hypothetical protein
MCHSVAGSLLAARRLSIQTYDAKYLTMKCFADLSAIFDAIRVASKEDSTAYKLAGIGRYLADDWSNTADYELENIQALINQLDSNIRPDDLSDLSETIPHGGGSFCINESLASKCFTEKGVSKRDTLTQGGQQETTINFSQNNFYPMPKEA